MNAIRPISDFLFPLENAAGKPVEAPGWTCHNPMQEGGLVFQSNVEGKYGRVYHIAYTADDKYNRDGMLRAERGGAIDLVIDTQGRFGLQQRERMQTNLSAKQWQEDYDQGYVNWQQIGRTGWEAPRGYGDKLKKLADTAQREAEEETGFRVLSHEHLCWGNDNTATAVHMTGVFLVELDLGTPSGAVDEDHEKALSEVTYFDEAGLLGLIESGDLYCFMTLGAMTPLLLRRSLDQKTTIETLRAQLSDAGIEPAV